MLLKAGAAAGHYQQKGGSPSFWTLAIAPRSSASGTNCPLA